MDFVVLKRLTLKSDLGWFKSIFDAHQLQGHQKGITLNKKVIYSIWPSLMSRETAYDAAREVQKQAEESVPPDEAKAQVEKTKAKAAGTIPDIQVQIYGPAGKPRIDETRIIALQDKNWRLDGAFILDPLDDPTRFHPILNEGDLALIGFNGGEWPTEAVVVLISQSSDPLWSDLSPLTPSKGAKSMVQLDQPALIDLADKHGLPADHVIRSLAVTSISALPVPAAPVAVITPLPVKPGGGMVLPLTPKSGQELTPEELAKQLAQMVKTGEIGEKLVDQYLKKQANGTIPIHAWVSSKLAKHPYDFQLIAESGTVLAFIDAKATSTAWPGEFFMSMAEVYCAATSTIPYHIYRLSNVKSSGAELRISDDVRQFAEATVKTLLPHLLSGTRITEIAVKPIDAGIKWSDPIKLPPLPP